ncbi:hypothetical protein ACQR0Z_17425 [Bradyrhizobium sp. HKCCYLS3077]|uniref:hypothetical protein n=1 Tax=Bradyrhizobium sp. HKCCYLS3077 TaxID=3420761 RepID=UPI003EB94EDA
MLQSIKFNALPNAQFANLAALCDYAGDAIRYDAAITRFEAAVRPATIRSKLAQVRRAGYSISAADLRECARLELAATLIEIGYDDSAIEWHANRPGRRERRAYVA